MLGLILTINTYFTSILTVPPNLLVIYFSITSGIKEIPEYRFIIIVQAVNDILNSIILSTICMGNTQSPEGYTIVEMGILAKTNEHVGITLYGFYSFLYIFNLFLVPILFLYRYTMICNAVHLKRLFKSFGVAVLAITTLSLSAYTAITSTVICSFSRNKTVDEIFGAENALIIQVPNDIYTPAAMSNSLNYQVFTSGISAIILAALVFGGYAIVIVTSKRIFDTLNNVHLSERTKRLQKQLVIIMLSQSFLPLICIIAPLAILFVLIYSRMAIGPYASFTSILLNWQPCPQVFIALTFLSPFRRRIRAILHYERGDSTVKNTKLTAHSAHSNGVQNRVLDAP